MLATLTLLLGITPRAVLPGGATEPGDVEILGDTILRPLTDTRGDASRGREIAFDRERGNCSICHVLPAPDAALHGAMGPSLRNPADWLSEGQIRLRLVDGSRLSPSTAMTTYYRVSGLKRGAAAYASKPVLAV